MRSESRLRWSIIVAPVLLACASLPVLGHQEAAPGAAAGKARPELGASFAATADGRLWAVTREARDGHAQLLIRTSSDLGASWSAPAAINAVPEPISADGENRPKLAVGPTGELYVSWTQPTSNRYTGDIRFSRSLDGGRSWSAPLVIHQDRQFITHRFDALTVTPDGMLWAAWIDKRDLAAATAARRPYRGAAIYYAVSKDQGATWQGDYKLADHTCECCRIALAPAGDGQAAAFYRHVFEPSIRDHALAVLNPDGKVASFQRATRDNWNVAACPHHGPSLARDDRGQWHAVWFSVAPADGGTPAGQVFYGRLGAPGKAMPTAPEGQRRLPDAAAGHADLLANGARITIAWTSADQRETCVRTMISEDRGNTWSSPRTLGCAAGAVDQVRLFHTPDGARAGWHTAAKGLQVFHVDAPAAAASSAPNQPPAATNAAAAPAAIPSITPLEADRLPALIAALRGTPFWLVLWSLDCAYCRQSLQNLAAAQARGEVPAIITMGTDPHDDPAEMAARLGELGVQGRHYLSTVQPAQLRAVLDPDWGGETPRSYFYDADGRRQARSGMLTRDGWRRSPAAQTASAKPASSR